MSEMDRIADAIAEQGDYGVIVENNHYRANGPTRSIVHMLARAWGLKARTHLECIERDPETDWGVWWLWYKLEEVH